MSWTIAHLGFVTRVHPPERFSSDLLSPILSFRLKMTRKSHTRRTLTPLCTEIKVGYACTSVVCFSWSWCTPHFTEQSLRAECMGWVEMSPTLLSAKSLLSLFANESCYARSCFLNLCNWLEIEPDRLHNSWLPLIGQPIMNPLQWWRINDLDRPFCRFSSDSQVSLSLSLFFKIWLWVINVRKKEGIFGGIFALVDVKVWNSMHTQAKIIMKGWWCKVSGEKLWQLHDPAWADLWC